MKRYIKAAEINIGPYTYKSEHYLKKAARNSTDPKELRAIYESKPSTWVKEELARNENTPVDIFEALVDNIKSGRIGVSLADNPSTPKDVLKSLFYATLDDDRLMYDHIIATKIIRMPEFSGDAVMRRLYIENWPGLVRRVKLFEGGYQKLEGLDPMFSDDVNDTNFMLNIMDSWLDDTRIWDAYSTYVSNPKILDRILECNDVFAIINVLNNPRTSGSSIRKFVENYLDIRAGEHPNYFDDFLNAIKNNPNTPNDIVEEIEHNG